MLLIKIKVDAGQMEMNERIVAARREAGLTQEGLAKAVGKTRGAVALWESGEVRPRHKTIIKIAEATNKPLAWLESGVGISDEGGGLMVVGTVAAGVWKEGSVSFAQFPLPVSPHPGYPAHAQQLWAVEGTSINRKVGEGEYLHVVDVQEAGLEPRHEDIVIVRRMEHDLAEYTAKILIRDGNRWLLRPSSYDPKWQADIVLEGDDSTSIEIIAIGIGKWEPLGRERHA